MPMDDAEHGMHKRRNSHSRVFPFGIENWIEVRYVCKPCIEKFLEDSMKNLRIESLEREQSVVISISH
jgi:hypothetical protein